MKLAVGTILHGRYEITGEVGHGGVSTIYEVRDLLLGGTLALKRLLFINDETRRAFAQEARLLAGLSHHGFPRVIDLFDEGGQDYLVMELISGPDLETIARERGGPIPFPEVAEWAEQILDAIVYLHSCRPPIIHRDIKPSNIKLTPYGRVMLVDFGLAKRYDRSDSRPGYTESYAPLEQLQHQGTDPSSDLYALGATLYRLLAGRVPESALVRLEARLSGSPDPLRPVDDINPTVPPSFARALEHALVLDRAGRMDSTSELKDALTEARNQISASQLLAWAKARSDEPGDGRAGETEGAERPGAERRAAANTVDVTPLKTATHRLQATTQLPRADLAEVLSLGVVPETGKIASRLAERLQWLVERSPSFQQARSRHRMRGFPMADGLVIAFFQEPLLALRTALEVGRAWRLDPDLSEFGLRMGLSRGSIMREAGALADARMANPGVARAREVMRLAEAGQLLLPDDLTGLLTQLTSSGGGLVDLGERALSDQSRVHLYAHSFRFQPEPERSTDRIRDQLNDRLHDQPTELSGERPYDGANDRYRERPNDGVYQANNRANERPAERAHDRAAAGAPPGPLPPPPNELLRPAVVAPSYGAAEEQPPYHQPFASPPPAASPLPAAPVDTGAIAAQQTAGSGSIAWPQASVAQVADEVDEEGEEEEAEDERRGVSYFWRFVGFVAILAVVAALWRPWEGAGDTTSTSSGGSATGIEMEFVAIRAGKFLMGANDRESDERPAHEVYITRDFEIGKKEVTQAQWKEIMDGWNPSTFVGDDLPVTNISWRDADRFTERLTRRMNDQYIYRLPTEAEWEYCARAGSSSQEVSDLAAVAHFGQTAGGPRPVGLERPNLWEIYDMLGNVFEWCKDNYSARTYQPAPVEDPEGPLQADPDTGCVIRGGGWRSRADKCRPGYRGYFPPERGNDEIGLRVVRVKRRSSGG